MYDRNIILAEFSNDIRNGMHIVSGMLDLLSETRLSPEQHNYVVTCRSSADRLSRSFHNVDELIQAVPANVAAERFSLREFVEGLDTVVNALSARKGLSSQRQNELGSVDEVIGDRDRLERMLMELIDSAITVTESGRILVRMNASEAEGGSAILDVTVASTARVEPEAVEDLLSGYGYHPGLGLALAVTRKIAENLGGRLRISETPGMGFSMTVTLPFVIAPLPTSSSGQASGLAVDSGNHRVRILVAEDSDDAFALFKAYLVRGNHDVERAVNGQQAVDLAKAGKYDLIFMDIHMPIMDGYAATREIRHWETRQGVPRIPIVVLSADSLAAQRQMGALAGCSGHLQKPVSCNVVLEVIDRYAPATN